MLVVTANWAIPDGSVAEPPRPAPFLRLLDDLRLAALRAGFGRDGRYRPVERVVVVLAGDTLDGLVSGRWLEGVRPWDRGRRARALHEEVLHAAWRHARRPLAAVTRLARRGLAVPTADRHGRPALGLPTAVPVRAVLLLGDRDAALGRFAGRRSVGIGTVWEGAGLTVAHGALADPLAVPERGPTLLESLAVDLLARFGATLAERPALATPGRGLVRILAAARPLDMPLRLRASLAAEPAAAGRITDAWRRAVDRWAREARRAGCGEEPGTVDALAAWMHARVGGAAPVPAAAEIVAALSAALPAAVTGAGGPGLTVLGHPGVDSGTARVVGLGPPPEDVAAPPFLGGATAVSCTEAAPAVPVRGPAAVAVFEDGESLGFEPRWAPVGGTGAAVAARPVPRPILDAA
ncbi:MAG: hypothetical protein EBZ74_01005 [Planctomycetia bacterium]|nr:hypothetical protein [Planctomycetia bacterium]